MDDYIYHEAAADPPPGVHSNFEHPPGSAVVANTIVSMALVTVTVFAWTRLYIKIRIVHKLHAEDCKPIPLSHHYAGSLIESRPNTLSLGKLRHLKLVA
jgi:hypothetical protein